MIETSRTPGLRLFAALLLLAAGCSILEDKQIPCADDSSCPADYPVCAAGKCTTGTPSSAVSVSIVGVEGHGATDIVRQTVLINVTARSSSGIAGVALVTGSKTFAPKTSNPPLFTFEVDTTAVDDGPHDFTATVTPGDGSAAKCPAAAAGAAAASAASATASPRIRRDGW